MDLLSERPPVGRRRGAEKLENGDIQARKAYLRAVISCIEVDDDRVRTIGEKAALADVIAGRQTRVANVSGFIRKWRAVDKTYIRPLTTSRMLTVRFPSTRFAGGIHGSTSAHMASVKSPG
jgi:hypothetical protein